MDAEKKTEKKEGMGFMIIMALELLTICTVFLLCTKFFFDRHIQGKEGYDITRRKISSLVNRKTAEAAEARDLRSHYEKYGIETETESEDWEIMLVNKDNAIPDNYDIPLMCFSDGTLIDERIYTPLDEMFYAMRAEGIYPQVLEAYRSRDMQTAMMEEKVNYFMKEGLSEKKAKESAKKWVAEPGHSEHELGLAVDICADDMFSTDEAVYEWLARNAHNYGFIFRYPEGKEDITGIGFEPWHYRFVGEKAAREIYQSGLTLEEYLAG